MCTWFYENVRSKCPQVFFLWQVWLTVTNQNKIVNSSGPLHHINAMIPARAKSLCKRSLQGSLTRCQFVSSKLFLSLSVTSYIIQTISRFEIWDIVFQVLVCPFFIANEKFVNFYQRQHFIFQLISNNFTFIQ